MTVTSQEAALIEATVKLANARELTSTRWVENLFRRVSAAPVFGRIATTKIKHYRKHQQDVRRWLGAIAAGRAATVAPDIALLFAKTAQPVQIQFRRRRGQDLQVVYVALGVQASYALACALLITRGLTTRLTVCRLQGCENFVVDLHHRRGAPQRYCRPAHQRQGYRALATKRTRNARHPEAEEVSR